MKRCWRGWAVGGLVAVLGLYAGFSIFPLESVGEFRARAERDLPPGTTAVEVEAWLRSHGYPCSSVVDSAGRRRGINGWFHNYLTDRVGLLASLNFLYYEFRLDDQDRTTGELWVREQPVVLQLAPDCERRRGPAEQAANPDRQGNPGPCP
jgi:hypothetical protein